MLSVAILSGGMATRLYPLTDSIPKALIEVAGVPFIFRQLKYLRTQGVKKVVLCVGHFGESIQNVVGNGTDFGLEVIYSHDGKTLLGTGGAIRNALPMLEETFFVLYGDSYLPIDFVSVEKAFFRSDKPALMTIMKNNNRWDKSNVVFGDGSLTTYSKKIKHPRMSFIDYGLSVIHREVLQTYDAHASFGLDNVFETLASEGLLEGYEVYNQFYEIGSISGLRETNKYFLKREVNGICEKTSKGGYRDNSAHRS
ncbi:MAG: sugar phosphate nucleotidyltransferase [Pseudomonadota bacterium]|nr:sugar phosphate nucleotidyltransferase [Pseudomonadota bacterium]